ncbi:MAG TPA: hypothetical protein VMH41_16825 [Mycobacteriales bacterium]|nr:hypothetical protein [Mycobacteriales bacterium]
MDAIAAGLAASFALCAILVIRALLVFSYTIRVIDHIHALNIADIDARRDGYGWRWQAFERCEGDGYAAYWQLWRRIPSFFPPELRP